MGGCSYASGSIDGIQNLRPYSDSLILIPLEPEIGMNAQWLGTQKHIHFDLIYLFLT